ncbi:VOC family protein [Sphingosinicella terrae]|uniref:VOC family protein n=1 Tax=Sphingosinicella terrae TaxID=2172047 RepID=UPI000E0D5B2D|nr:VOC family protein [Sphingosinicella terrae]
MASARYIVTDVDQAVSFYERMLDFTRETHNPGRFAALRRDDLTLYLSAPGAGSGGQAGGTPEPGGWNRIMIVVDALDPLVARLRSLGARFRGDVSAGGAGRAILIEDPSGNLVELFAFKDG